MADGVEELLTVLYNMIQDPLPYRLAGRSVFLIAPVQWN